MISAQNNISLYNGPNIESINVGQSEYFHQWRPNFIHMQIKIAFTQFQHDNNRIFISKWFKSYDWLMKVLFMICLDHNSYYEEIKFNIVTDYIVV